MGRRVLPWQVGVLSAPFPLGSLRFAAQPMTLRMLQRPEPQSFFSCCEKKHSLV